MHQNLTNRSALVFLEETLITCCILQQSIVIWRGKPKNGGGIVVSLPTFAEVVVAFAWAHSFIPGEKKKKHDS